MKIRIVSRRYIEEVLKEEPDWDKGKWIISIYSTERGRDFSPLRDRYNILKLQFDDISEEEEGFIAFNERLAEKVRDFIKDIKCDDTKVIYVHCDAGVSRSGGIGYILNEWFNKYLSNNSIDNVYFKCFNNHILPNPLVVRVLKEALFGKPFIGIEVNDYEYNEDGERIDHKKEI